MHPIESAAPLFILSFFALGFIAERLVPARVLPAVRGWRLRGALSFISTMAINALVPAAITAAAVGHTLLDLRGLGTLKGALLTFVAVDALSYGLHRLQHRWQALWRWTHQMHHSAERVDVLGAAYFHPFDIGLQAVVSTLVVLALGVTPDAAALGGVTAVLLAVFQHMNVRTPRWVGYILQRPEGHSVHHARDVHAYNFGNLSVWDLLFGTFRNPEGFEAAAGFYDGASARVGDMLLGRDVGAPSTARPPEVSAARSPDALRAA